MQNAIVKKLRGVLDGPVDTEPLVVYVLCEARKLLDYEDPTHQPTPLRMFCHWALHVDLTGRGTTEPFVQRVDHVVTNVLSGPTTANTLAAEHALVQEFASFDTFRTHLGEFLERHTLPTTLRDHDNAWYPFLEAYAGVIEDGSLKCPLDTIQGVTFTKGPSVSNAGTLSFTPTWVVSLKQARAGYSRLEVSAGTPAWGYHLRK